MASVIGPSAKKTRLSPIPKKISQIECEVYLKQPLAPTQHEIIVVLDGDQLSPSLKVINYATFVLTMQLKTRHTFVLECPLYNPIRDKFPSMFHNCSIIEPQVFVSIGSSS